MFTIVSAIGVGVLLLLILGVWALRSGGWLRKGRSWVASSSRAVPIVVGTDPLTDVGSVDGWTNILYINKSQTFDFTPAGTTEGAASTFSFWADNDTGIITPFIVEMVAPDKLTVRAIGTTRAGGRDWTGTGAQTFAFDEDGTPTIQQGWAVGFLTSAPDGTDVGTGKSGSPIPYATADGDGWLTGSGDTSGGPTISVGSAPTLGDDEVADADAVRRRVYPFQIKACTIPRDALP